MDLKIEGRVIQLLDEQSGEGRNGPWRKQDFILETEGEYPSKVCITQWGDDIEKFDIQEGERITAHIDVKSREYQGRWYTDVKAWRVQKDSQGQAGEGPGSPGQGGPPPAEFPDPDLDDEDLPF